MVQGFKHICLAGKENDPDSLIKHTCSVGSSMNDPFIFSMSLRLPASLVNILIKVEDRRKIMI
jgi:hypothetical protein